MTSGQWIPFLFGIAILLSIVFELWLIWVRLQMKSAVRKQDYARALSAGRIMLRIFPRISHWWAFQAGALMHLARYDEALAAAERAVTLAPRSTRSLLAKTHALLWLNRPKEAEVIARQALARVKNVATWSALGWALQAQYQMRPAADAYRAALALIPASAATPPPILSNLAVALSRLGRFDEALAVAQRAMSEHPGAISTLAYTQALVGLDRVDEAIGLLTQQLGPEYASQSQAIFAVITYRRHEDAQAAHLARSQAERSPGDARLWARLALAEMRLGNLADAERALTTGEQLGQDDYLLLAARSALHLAHGRASEALRLVDAALALAPLDVDVRAIRDEAQQALMMSRDA